MPLVYWSTQTTAAINLLRPEQSTTTAYQPYVSTANAAATIIQHAYTKYINHVMPHLHVTTNAPNQLDDIIWANINITTIIDNNNMRLDDITTRLGDNNTRIDDFKLDTNTQFDKFIAKLENYNLPAKDKFIAKLKNYKSIAKLDNYTNTAADNIVGDNRLLTDIEIREHAYQLLLRCDQLFDANDG